MVAFLSTRAAKSACKHALNISHTFIPNRRLHCLFQAGLGPHLGSQYHAYGWEHIFSAFANPEPENGQEKAEHTKTKKERKGRGDECTSSVWPCHVTKTVISLRQPLREFLKLQFDRRGSPCVVCSLFLRTFHWARGVATAAAALALAIDSTTMREILKYCRNWVFQTLRRDPQ